MFVLQGKQVVVSNIMVDGKQKQMISGLLKNPTIPVQTSATQSAVSFLSTINIVYA